MQCDVVACHAVWANECNLCRTQLVPRQMVQIDNDKSANYSDIDQVALASGSLAYFIY